MTTLRRFTCDDFFTFNGVNIDPLTETYNNGFYFHYLAKWADYFTIAEHPDGQCMGYVLGKAEGKEENWHGHVTAVTVAPEFRRLYLAQTLMKILETLSDSVYRGFFVDLFVRKSNAVAVSMYKKLGYSVYREVIGYYSGEENALDLRKAMSRDPEKKSEIPKSTEPVMPGPEFE